MNVGIFGKPRSGKTTLEAYYVDCHFRRLKLKNRFGLFYDFLCKIKICKQPYTAIYCNDRAFSFPGVIYYDIKTLGMWKPKEYSLVIMTESGINLSNRNTLTLSEYAERFFAYYGHLKVDLIYDSQADDVDIKLRNRTDYYYFVEKNGENNPNSIIQQIGYKIDVNEETHKIEEMFYLKHTPLWLILYRLTGKRWTLHRRKYYKYFNSWHDDMAYPMLDPNDLVGYERVISEQKKKSRSRIKR